MSGCHRRLIVPLNCVSERLSLDGTARVASVIDLGTFPPNGGPAP
jgi:hypothetical protein